MSSLLVLSRRCCLAGAFFCAAQIFAEESPSGPVIRLPEVVVSDNRDLPPPEKWRYAQIPGIEILSNASDKATQALLRDFQGFNLAVDVAWHGLQQNDAVPLTFIICGQGRKFDAFVPGREKQSETGRVSLLLQDREEATVVLDFETRTVHLSSVGSEQAAIDSAAALDAAPSDSSQPDENTTTTVGKSSDALEVDSYKQLHREYIRFLMSSAQPRLPAWFEEGLAQLFMGMTYDRHSITFAKLEDPNTTSISGAAEDRDFNRALARRALMPLSEFFAVERDSPTALNPLGSLWAKQAQAFVHFCLYGENQKYQRSFIAFLTRVQREPVSEKVFKDCFQMSYQEMLIALRGYQQFASYKSFEWRLPRGQSIPEAPLVAMREATQSEIGRIKGEALRLADHAEAAHVALVAPYLRGERDPRLLACLGLEESDAGRADRARQFLEAAVKAGIPRPRAYIELARLRFESARAAAGSDGKLESEQVVSILDPLFHARSLPPPLPELYTLIARTWAMSAVAPGRGHFEAVLEGVRLFPQNMELIYQATVLAAHQGFPAEAAALAELGRKNTTEPAEKSRFEALSAEIARAAAAAPSSLSP